MSNPHEQPDWLDKYLDSAPDSPERAEMDRALNSNRQMQVDLQLQMQIEESLKRLFVPLAAPANLLATLQAQPSVARPAIHSRRNWRKLAVAATAVSVAWGFLAWRYLVPTHYPPAPKSTISYSDPYATTYDPNLSLTQIYEQSVANGFRPGWVCDDPHEFASTFLRRQGQGLLLAELLPTGTKMEGLTYCGGISRDTTTMFARVDGQPVMVFVDRANGDTHPVLPTTETKLHLFRKELGPLVMYELSPLDHAAVMDYLHLADVPPESK